MKFSETDDLIQAAMPKVSYVKSIDIFLGQFLIFWLLLL